jgi:hypothetical protein
VTAVWLFLRAEARRRWRAWLSLALIVGVFTGGVVTAAAGALRTGSAYARFLDWSRAPDVVVDAEPYNPMFAPLSPTAVMRVPQAADAAVLTSFGAGIVQLIAPASNAIPGGFWKGRSFPAVSRIPPGPARSTSRSLWPSGSTCGSATRCRWC